MSENDLNMIDLVLTHLNQLWGAPRTLATIATCLKMANIPQNRLWVYNFFGGVVALSYLFAWAAKANKRNSNFEVKRNTLLSTVLQTQSIRTMMIDGHNIDTLMMATIRRGVWRDYCIRRIIGGGKLSS